MDPNLDNPNATEELKKLRKEVLKMIRFIDLSNVPRTDLLTSQVDKVRAMIPSAPNCFMNYQGMTVCAVAISTAKKSKSHSVIGIGAAFGQDHELNSSDSLPLAVSDDLSLATLTGVVLAMTMAETRRQEKLLIIVENSKMVQTINDLDEIARKLFIDFSAIYKIVLQKLCDLKSKLIQFECLHFKNSSIESTSKQLMSTANQLALQGRKAAMAELELNLGNPYPNWNYNTDTFIIVPILRLVNFYFSVILDPF